MDMWYIFIIMSAFEPRREKTGLRGFRPNPTQTGLHSHRTGQEACNFGNMERKKRTIRVAKTKALISCAVTAQLICGFVFAHAKVRFSHEVAHLSYILNLPHKSSDSGLNFQITEIYL